MNRRDYLIGMGAAAGALACSGKLAARPNQPKPITQQRPTPKPSIGTAEQPSRSEKPTTWEHRWPDPIPTYGRNEVVKLIFYGQNGFSSRMNGRACDVGFHSRGDSTHRHRLSIAAYDQAYSSERCHSAYTTDPDPASHVNVERIALIVNPNDVSTRDARFKNGVYFFQPGNGEPAARRHLEHPKDFRWLIDFESDYLYGKFLPANDKKLPKVPEVYRPAFSIPYGLFYTLHRSGSTFRSQTKKGEYVSDLGPVADLIAANVYLQPDAAITLQVNGTTTRVQAPGEIYFYNICYRNTDYILGCETEPHNLDEKEKRSDFFLNYRAFRRGSAREYELFLAENLEPENDDLDLVCSNAFLESHAARGVHHGPFVRRQEKLAIVNDESPCAGVGYSGGGGIPLYP